MFSKTEFCLLNFIKITISRYFRISFKPFYFAANKLNDLLYEKKMGIIYGSSTGTCESIAQTIAEKLGVASVDVIDASKITTEKVESYDILLLGTSTWGEGELQDDWYDAIKMIKTADLNGKIVALFGCGDSESYCDTFCDGMGVIYDQLKNSGCTFVGAVSADGYSYSSSIAIIDGKFVGLALDDVNESGKTEERINSWVEEIKKNL